MRPHSIRCLKDRLIDAVPVVRVRSKPQLYVMERFNLSRCGKHEIHI